MPEPVNARRQRVGLLMAMLILASCGVGSLTPPATQVPTATTSPASSGVMPTVGQSPTPADADLTGVLGGDPQLESGCTWLLDEAGQRWEVLWPPGYQTEFRGELTVLTGPRGESVASTGDRLAVNGVEPTDLGSFCMVGRVFEATDVVVIQALDEFLDCRHGDPTLCRGVATWALRELGMDIATTGVQVDDEPACPNSSECAPPDSQHLAGVIVSLGDGTRVLFNLVDLDGQPALVRASTD